MAQPRVKRMSAQTLHEDNALGCQQVLSMRPQIHTLSLLAPH